MYEHHENTRYPRRAEGGYWTLQTSVRQLWVVWFGARNWIWILQKKIGVLTPRATSLAPRHVLPPSITPSVFQNHCLRTVILKCDPDGLLCESLSCGLQGQNFDSRILFALPPTLSEMPCCFPEAVWHHNLIELVTEPNMKTQVSSTKPGL